MPACISSIFLRVTLTVVSQSMCVATVCCTGAARTRTKPKKPGTYVDRKYRVLFESRGLDLNQRPSGYEPDELPGCSTPQSSLVGLAAAGVNRPAQETGLPRAFLPTRAASASIDPPRFPAVPAARPRAGQPRASSISSNISSASARGPTWFWAIASSRVRSAIALASS